MGTDEEEGLNDRLLAGKFQHRTKYYVARRY